MMARKFGKQLIVAVSEKDAIKLKDNFDIIGMLSYGKENFIAMSHTKSEFGSKKREMKVIVSNRECGIIAAGVWAFLVQARRRYQKCEDPTR